MRRYVVADLHGYYNLYEQIKDFIDKDDVVYALGDFGDRGPQPWETLKAGLDDPQFIYLMGNHDHMLIESIEFALHYAGQYDDWDWNEDYIPFNPNLDSNYNGGWETFCGWARDSDRIKYYQKLQSLPLMAMVNPVGTSDMVYLCHAGFTPGDDYPAKISHFVWDRCHIYDEWPDLLMAQNMYVIHGHTINQYMGDFMNPDDRAQVKLHQLGAIWYANGHKCCIDQGAVLTHSALLMNLDTFEEHIFTVPDDKLLEEDNEW